MEEKRKACLNLAHPTSIELLSDVYVIQCEFLVLVSFPHPYPCNPLLHVENQSQEVVMLLKSVSVLGLIWVVKIFLTW